MSERLERVCARCRLVYVEAPAQGVPVAPGYVGVCPRCGLVADLAAVTVEGRKP